MFTFGWSHDVRPIRRHPTINALISKQHRGNWPTPTRSATPTMPIPNIMPGSPTMPVSPPFPIVVQCDKSHLSNLGKPSAIEEVSLSAQESQLWMIYQVSSFWISSQFSLVCSPSLWISILFGSLVSSLWRSQVSSVEFSSLLKLKRSASQKKKKKTSQRTLAKLHAYTMEYRQFRPPRIPHLIPSLNSRS